MKTALLRELGYFPPKKIPMQDAQLGAAQTPALPTFLSDGVSLLSDLLWNSLEAHSPGFSLTLKISSYLCLQSSG